MIDSGATGIFIDEEFCRRKNIVITERNRPINLTLFDGSSGGIITHQAQGTLIVNGSAQELTLDVTKLTAYPIVLGLPWLRLYNPKINWSKDELSLLGTQEKSLEEQIPKELHEFLEVFSVQEAKVVPPHTGPP